MPYLPAGSYLYCKREEMFDEEPATTGRLYSMRHTQPSDIYGNHSTQRNIIRLSVPKRRGVYGPW